jgi:thymidine phosphorylase
LAAGVLLAVTHGDKVEKGQTLARLYAADRSERLAGEAKALAAALRLSPARPAQQRMILEVIG